VHPISLRSDPAYPVVPVCDNLSRIELPVKTTTNLSFVMAIEAEHRQVVVVIVGRIFIYVVNLDGLFRFAANTAGSIRGEKHLSSGISGDFGSRFSCHPVINLMMRAG